MMLYKKRVSGKIITLNKILLKCILFNLNYLKFKNHKIKPFIFFPSWNFCLVNIWPSFYVTYSVIYLFLNDFQVVCELFKKILIKQSEKQGYLYHAYNKLSRTNFNCKHFFITLDTFFNVWMTTTIL